MSDINKICKILEYRKRNDLSKVLQNSRSEVSLSSTYGTYLYSILSTFDVYSPLQSYDKLKNLSEGDKKIIFDAVVTLYPPKEESPEITDVRFYLDPTLDNEYEIDENVSYRTQTDESMEQYDIFVSHSHEDYEQVKALVDVVKNYGFSVFLAHRDIKPSAEWGKEILRVLKSAPVFIAYLTPNFKKSNWCDQEVGVGFSNGVKFVPIIALQNTNPYGFIGKFQGLRLPHPQSSGVFRLIRETVNNAYAIVKFLLTDTETKVFARDRIFSKLKTIQNFNSANLIFSALDKMQPFSDEEKMLIITEYEKNEQISNAFSTEKLYKKLKGTQ